jgi:hypothetical protein
MSASHCHRAFHREYTIPQGRFTEKLIGWTLAMEPVLCAMHGVPVDTNWKMYRPVLAKFLKRFPVQTSGHSSLLSDSIMMVSACPVFVMDGHPLPYSRDGIDFVRVQRHCIVR